MPSIYSTPKGFVALLLKPWWTESLTVQIVPYIRRRVHHAVVVQGWPAVLVLPCSCQALLLPLGHCTSILDHKALQSPVSILLPWACSSVGCNGSLTAPPKLPSHTSCNPTAFRAGKAPGFPTSSHCLLTPVPAYTTLSTTLWVQQSTVALLIGCTIP